MDIVKGKIGNALTSAASNHVVATANDIYDESIGKYQNEINGGFYSIPIAAALGISTKYDVDNNLVLNIPFSQGGKSRNTEVVIPTATSTEPGLMAAIEHKDLKTLVGKGAVNRNITFEIDENNKDNVKLSYYAYEGNDRWENRNVSIPLATGNNAGLISHELYSKTTNFLNNSPIIDDFSIVVGDTPDDIRFHYTYLDTDGIYQSNAIPIPLATGDKGGIISADLYQYLYSLQNSAIHINTLEIKQATDGLTLKYNSRRNKTVGSTNVNIPLASNTANGVLSKEDYVALHNLIDNSSSTNSFIEYNQGHNTCDDFADIPTNKHICLVDLTGIAVEGVTPEALTVVMEGTGEYDGAEVLLYCHHNGTANLGIGVPASSTNGAEYVLIPNNGDQYIYAGIQELDFVLSCTYINNKWYVRKA